MFFGGMSNLGWERAKLIFKTEYNWKNACHIVKLNKPTCKKKKK